MDQLTYVQDHRNNSCIIYYYDSKGNLEAVRSFKNGEHNIPYDVKSIYYSYDDPNWKDKLTAYDGQTITYDEIGNPLSYRDGITMTWKNGRQLATLNNADNTVSYSYDSNSVRKSKTVNGVEYTYVYLGGNLMYETRGNAKFYYSYDANGTLCSVKYKADDNSSLQTYYYTHNSMGDIIGIYDEAGQLKARYEYDAWGTVLSITDQNGNEVTSSTHIANLNPFRYRGYYYDAESGLYYLMSRYYDPVTYRFINADGYFQSGGDILDANTSAYCRNNPISFFDPTGTKCSLHTSWYVSNCFACNPFYRDFVNNNIDWYNKTSGKAPISAVNFDGTVCYEEKIVVDHNTTEAKVFRTLGIFLESFSASGDIGFGIGLEEKFLVNITAVSKAALYVEISRDGLDTGTYCGNDFSANVASIFTLWDFEMAGKHSFVSDSDIAVVGPNKKVSFGEGIYGIVGASYEISFDYGYFGNEFTKLWW